MRKPLSILVVALAAAGVLHAQTHVFDKIKFTSDGTTQTTAAPIGWADVKHHGAVGDAKAVATGAITLGTDDLTIGSSQFVAGDVGKKIVVQGAGAAGADLSTTIAAFVSGTAVTLAVNASTTVSNARTVWGTNDDAAFTAAFATGRSVYVPSGNYLANVVITSRNDISFEGAGNATQIIPGTGTAVAVTTSTFLRMDNMKIGWATTGVNVAGADGSIFSRLYVLEQTGDGIKIDGDQNTEFEIRDTYIQSQGGYGLNYTRTTGTDTGGLYLTNVWAQGTTGTDGGFRFTSSNATPTPVFLIGANLIADGHPASSFILNNVYEVQLQNVWAFGNNTTANAAFYVNNVFGPAAGRPALQLDNARIQNTHATGYGLQIDGASAGIFLDQIGFTGAGTALQWTGTAMSAVYLGAYTVETGLTFTNDATRIAIEAPTSQPRTPFHIYTDDVAGSQSAFGLVDSGGGGSKYFRISSAGALEILNSAYDTVLATLLNTGKLGLGVSPSHDLHIFQGANLDAEVVVDSNGAVQGYLQAFASGTDEVRFGALTNHAVAMFVNSVEEARLSQSGFNITNGMAVGHSGTPVDDVVSIGNADFHLDAGGGSNPRITFDSGDDFLFERTGNDWLFRIAGTSEFTFDANGLRVSNGVAVGTLLAAAADNMILIDATTQANLGTPTNGTISYCSDCTIANPCAGGGTGALAKRLNATWVCN